jgi:hypothetical protein
LQGHSDSTKPLPVPIKNDPGVLTDNTPREPSAPSRSTFDFVFPIDAAYLADNHMDGVMAGSSRPSREHTPEALPSDPSTSLQPSSSARRRSARLSIKREKVELEALALGLESPDTGLRSRGSPQKPGGELLRQSSPSKSRKSPRKHAKHPLSTPDAPDVVNHPSNVLMDPLSQSLDISISPVKGKGKSRAPAAWQSDEIGLTFTSVSELDDKVLSDVFSGDELMPLNEPTPQHVSSSEDVPPLPWEPSDQPDIRLERQIDPSRVEEEEILEALDSVHVTPPKEQVTKRRTSIDMALLAANVQRPPIPKTPSKPSSSASPEKTAFGDPERTPARRVTMEEAVAHGSISPAKAASMATKPFGTGIVRPPVFTRPVLDDPNRSPAGKGFLALKHQSQPQESERREQTTTQRLPPSRPSRIPNTTTNKPPMKSASTIKSRGLVRPPPSSSSSAKLQNQTTLPFPISPAKPTVAKPAGSSAPSSSRLAVSRSTATPQPKSVRPKTKPAPATQTSSARSTLKEPTTVNSKIPRVGAKPYTRAPGTVRPSRPVKSASGVVKKIANLSLVRYFKWFSAAQALSLSGSFSDSQRNLSRSGANQECCHF